MAHAGFSFTPASDYSFPANGKKCAGPWQPLSSTMTSPLSREIKVHSRRKKNACLSRDEQELRWMATCCARFWDSPAGLAGSGVQTFPHGQGKRLGLERLLQKPPHRGG